LLAFEILLWIFLGEFLFRTVCTVAFTPSGSFFAQTLVSVAFLFVILFVTAGSCILIWHELDLKDAAMRFLKTTDVNSGLRNRMTFLQLVETRLAQNDAAGGGSIAVLRVRPSLEDDSTAGSGDESKFYRAVGARIDELLDKVDLLARYGDDEFGILFVKKDAAQAARVLESVLADLHARPVAIDGERFSATGNAAVIACQAPLATAVDFMKMLRRELEVASEVGIRVARIEHPAAAKRSVGR
jgi:GGDEF domain-containing protein